MSETAEPSDRPAPGTPENPATLTDPQMMRALAHSARIAIWAHLALHGPATATECAEVAGLSPSACSYHLRTLAKYGIVEEDPDSAADGRQRPWRVKMVAFNIKSVDPNPAVTLDGRFLTESIRAATEENRARYLDRQAEYPVDWQEAIGEYSDVAHLTPAELDALKHRIAELIGPYRRLDPAERPPGTLPVQIAIDTYPWFGPDEAKRAAEEAGQ
jgi:DNA-binding transcriptional ArsR family regulator